MNNRKDVRSFLKEYGEHFRHLRLKAGLGQLKVANHIGCSQAIISHIECGYMLPPQDIEDRLILLLGGNNDDKG